jgi:hypothetical protein
MKRVNTKDNIEFTVAKRQRHGVTAFEVQIADVAMTIVAPFN